MIESIFEILTKASLTRIKTSNKNNNKYTRMHEKILYLNKKILKDHSLNFEILEKKQPFLNLTLRNCREPR